MNVTENVEGRERYPVNVQYERDFRDDVESLKRVLIATPAGSQVPIEQVAKISFSRGPAMIRDEEGQVNRVCLHRSKHERLRRLCQSGVEIASRTAESPAWLHLSLVGRV